MAEYNIVGELAWRYVGFCMLTSEYIWTTQSLGSSAMSTTRLLNHILMLFLGYFGMIYPLKKCHTAALTVKKRTGLEHWV